MMFRGVWLCRAIHLEGVGLCRMCLWWMRAIGILTSVVALVQNPKNGVCPVDHSGLCSVQLAQHSALHRKRCSLEVWLGSKLDSFLHAHWAQNSPAAAAGLLKKGRGFERTRDLKQAATLQACASGVRQGPELSHVCCDASGGCTVELVMSGRDLITSEHLHSEAIAAVGEWVQRSAPGVDPRSPPPPPAGTSKNSPAGWQAAARGAPPRAREEEAAEGAEGEVPPGHRPSATARPSSPGVSASPAA